MGYKAAIWLDWGVFFTVEADADAVRDLMAPGLEAIGPVPGRVLLHINLVHFIRGGDGIELAACDEIDIGVAVPVDNSAYEGLPQAAAHILNISATSPDYMEICRQTGYRLHDGHGLRFDLAKDGLSGGVADDAGPILDFRTNMARPPRSRVFSRVGQDVVHDERGQYRVNYVFAGKGLDGLADDAFALNLHHHPFFLGLVDSGAPKQYPPFAVRRGRKATISFYGPDFPDDGPE